MSKNFFVGTQKKILLGIVFIFLANFTISCKKAERSGLLEGRHSGLYVIEVGGKFGYINNSAQIVINPQFDSASDFSEGLAAVTIGRKVGYINKTGKYVINPQFDSGSDFNEERAAVMIGRKWGCIDRSGKYVINPQFDGAMGFSEGLAAVLIGDKWGYIDKSGKYVINPQFDSASDFSEGLVMVWIGGNWGYVDRSGRYTINPQFDGAMGFSEGLAAVQIGGKWGYIDKSGKYAINPQFDRAMGFSEGLAAVMIGGNWGYVDRSGKYAINPQFDSASDFKEERAAVLIGGNWGYIDRSGKIVISPQFGFVNKFSGGLAKVWIGGKWGYIDTSGKYIWDLPFKEALKQHLSQAQTFLDDKNFSQALSECELALAYDNQNEQALSLKQQVNELITKERITDLLYRAQLHLNGGDYDTALGLCEEVLKYDAQNQEALNIKNKTLEIKTILGYEQQTATPVRAIGQIRPPRLMRKVDPIYPEIARQTRVEGVVILEVTTDFNGRVQDAKVLRSIPLLDQAAIDAVRQWQYEPATIDGKPRGIIFTVTVRFQL